ncbi:hypothetical protein BFF78_41200 [Streptomyces fodineus]|uniref:Ketosynthase family 3 (KS3) domain-containing protein n=1 Tax=Streptomyces fodineus TaxID=1904616 RepID=A0A1D7YM03_9ACTN|nr:beta-ketoacyl synthase N-terminal-like domain-containing protein [Streptomyces fodineus]AOR36627.1 hypothetical protein BFF78_41200 [Streptomyces fodineus]
MRDLPAHAVAVVGIGCRFPRADGPDAFWRLLRGGGDAITGRRGGRGPARGGFLDRVDGFDPGFFGISHREAVAMDPQERLALELAWEALENARTLPGDLEGSRTGVFLGAIADDYATLLHALGPDAVTGVPETARAIDLLAQGDASVAWCAASR